MRVKRNPRLVKSLSTKINISSVNESLSGKKQSEIANIYKLSKEITFPRAAVT